MPTDRQQLQLHCYTSLGERWLFIFFPNLA